MSLFFLRKTKLLIERLVTNLEQAKVKVDNFIIQPFAWAKTTNLISREVYALLFMRNQNLVKIQARIQCVAH